MIIAAWVLLVVYVLWAVYDWSVNDGIRPAVFGSIFLLAVFILSGCGKAPTEPPCPTVWEGQGDSAISRGCVTGVTGGIEGVKK